MFSAITPGAPRHAPEISVRDLLRERIRRARASIPSQQRRIVNAAIHQARSAGINVIYPTIDFRDAATSGGRRLGGYGNADIQERHGEVGAQPIRDVAAFSAIDAGKKHIGFGCGQNRLMRCD